MKEEGKWVTINGTHVFIKDGQSPIDALVRQQNKKMPHSQSYNEIAYHASNADFEEFDTSKIGTGQGENTQGNGINLASTDSVKGVYGDILYVVKVDLKNAYTTENKKILSTFEKDFGYKTTMDEVSNELKKKGYDGIVQVIPYNNNKLYTIFDAKNVKIVEKQK